MEEQQDASLLLAAEDAVTSVENLPRPSTCEMYESFESFMQTLAPSAELPTTDDASIIPDMASSVPGTGEIDATGADSETVCTPEEVQRLKDLVALLQVRLDATAQVVEIQEKEICRKLDGDEDLRSDYEKLLTRWRREVCILLLRQRVDAFQVEQRRLQQTQKEQHLIVQLHEARAVVEVLKQKERNLQAEMGILTTGQKLAEMTMRAEAARRQHDLEGTIKGVTRAAVETLCSVVDEHSVLIFHQLEQLGQASCRLDMYGERLRFSEQQVMTVVNNMYSDGKSSGTLTHRRNFEENITIEKLRSVERRRDRPQPAEQVLRRPASDHAGRANQLEVLLAATKSQLTEECLHARELQERIGKLESESREAVKRATRKAQEQAERDLVAIKRQQTQIVQTLQRKTAKLQSDHAKSIVAYHQLERRLSQQQQEFVQTLNQRDNEFRRSLDVKEIEVNGLLDEQNALLNKLKKFWRPILNSSAAKIFTEKAQRSQLQTPLSSSQNVTPQECKIQDSDSIGHPDVRSVETQTVVVELKREKKKKAIKPDNNSEPEQEDTEQKDTKESRPKKTDSTGFSRLSTPAKAKNKHEGKVKRSEEALISSYLSKLQKSYVSPNKQHSLHSQSTKVTRTLESMTEKKPETKGYSGSSSPNRQDHKDGRVHAEVRSISRQSPAFSDSQSMNDESLPPYIMCVPPLDISTAIHTQAQRQKQEEAGEISKSVLQEKLKLLEDLGETFVGHRM